MKMTKIMAIISIFLIACQAICGFSLANNPDMTAGGYNGFHTTVGILILASVTATAIGIFRNAKMLRREKSL